MNDCLTQRILELIYRDSKVRRSYKDSISDWILDTQSRAGHLSSAALLEYLGAHQPDVLERLKMNVSVGEDVARALGGPTRNYGCWLSTKTPCAESSCTWKRERKVLPSRPATWPD